MLSCVYFEIFYLTVFVVRHFHYIYELGNCHRCTLYIWNCFVQRLQYSSTTLLYLSMYELLDPETVVQRFDPTLVLYCTASFLSTLSFAYLLKIMHYSTTPGWMQCDRGSWIRWLVRRIRSCADKLGGGRERYTVQRTAKRYDDDGDGKYVGLRLPLLAAMMMVAIALSPQTNRRQMATKTSEGRKYSQLCVV